MGRRNNKQKTKQSQIINQKHKKQRSTNSKVGCVECGSRRNPCRCRVLGPTLGCLAFLVTAVVCWPVGAVVYIVKHTKGRRIMGKPAAVVYPKVSRCLPI
ncbi:hypothetical protein MKW94_028636 [Papaver nudicaule]|uniref:Uncharacterized protein n=1 Tax=Papaver nudicaule TaxID=74823 RepID=A0AA41V5I1_PAPNU|nr:hypothetical protein [Papaver nudicaule]MCL7035495.1 hypothetical protein [Papaver nudicaule]